MDFGDLKNDLPIKEKITKVHGSITKIKDILDVFQKDNVYNQLEPMDKIDYDLFLSYTLNTLYWIYLRTRGIDPNKNDVKNELNRIREYMVRAKEVNEYVCHSINLNVQLINSRSCSIEYIFHFLLRLSGIK